MGLYAAYLSAAMNQRLERLQSQALGVLSLREELSVMRDLCGQSLVAFERAKEAAEQLTDVAQRASMLRHATDMLVGAVNQVRDMVIAAKRVEESGAQVDLSIVHTMVSQMCEILDDEITEADGQLRMVGAPAAGIVDRVAQRLRVELLQVSEMSRGSKLSPARLDDEVRSMIATIPEVA